MNLSKARMAIIGLGYVGLPLAAEFGKHRPVLGFDINAARIAELQSGRDSTLEVEPQHLAAASQLQFSSNAADLQACQVLSAPGLEAPLNFAERFQQRFTGLHAEDVTIPARQSVHPPPPWMRHER